MKKIILIFSFLHLLLSTAVAQTKSVDIDNHWFTCSYRSLPTQPRTPVFFYYTTVVEATGVVQKNISVEEINNALLVHGQTKTDEPNDAQLSLELKLGNIIISNSDVNERKQEVKDRSGKVTAVNYFYSAHVTYTFEASGIIRSGEQILYNVVFYNRKGNITYVSEEFTKRKNAADFWNNNREVLISDFYRQHSLKSAEHLSSTATGRYGFKSEYGRDILKIIDEKKHNENEPFRNAVASLREALQSMTIETPMNRDTVNHLIEYFESIPEKYTDPKHKADVRLRYAAYFNLSKIYFYLDEPDNAAKYATLLVANGLDVKDGEKLKKEALELKSAFEKTGIKSRHLLIK
ncbi:MAG: hypothetical protein LBR10_09250 [Prevotellaceae bacterium]|jgi:hypothetical protein|nr:hypothetical protein [Prevotellaceae bacterium]